MDMSQPGRASYCCPAKARLLIRESFLSLPCPSCKYTLASMLCRSARPAEASVGSSNVSVFAGALQYF